MAPNDIIMEHFQIGQIPDFKKLSILDVKPEIFKCTLITIIEMIFRFNSQNKFLYFTQFVFQGYASRLFGKRKFWGKSILKDRTMFIYAAYLRIGE